MTGKGLATNWAFYLQVFSWLPKENTRFDLAEIAFLSESLRPTKRKKNWQNRIPLAIEKMSHDQILSTDLSRNLLGTKWAP
jgi:hypothetical protein